MAYISLCSQNETKKRIMIFAEGTILKPKSWIWLHFHKKYIPIGNSVDIICSWSKQGYEIVYCTSHKRHAKDIATLLHQYGFAGTRLYFREEGQTYGELVEEIEPSILIEDDCKSIGGSWQMCITNVSEPLKSRIQSIAVKEFGGIDHLSNFIFV